MSTPEQDASPRVLNKRDGGDGVYVGRPSKWGNPFVIGRDGTREQVIEKYRHTLTPAQVEAARRELRGKNLVCWCAPLPCHADVLLEIANGTD